MCFYNQPSRARARVCARMPFAPVCALAGKHLRAGGGAVLQRVKGGVDLGRERGARHDDRRLRDLLTRYLSENGFRVTAAEDAAAARARRSVTVRPPLRHILRHEHTKREAH